MKNLIDIFGKLKAGDVVLQQVVRESDNHTSYSRTKLVVIVGVDIWDQAVAVYYTDYKDFEFNGKPTGMPTIYSFGEWSEYWNVLGYWKKMPTFKQLLKAKRKEK